MSLDPPSPSTPFPFQTCFGLVWLHETYGVRAPRLSPSTLTKSLVTSPRSIRSDAHPVGSFRSVSSLRPSDNFLPSPDRSTFPWAHLVSRYVVGTPPVRMPSVVPLGYLRDSLIHTRNPTPLFFYLPRPDLQPSDTESGSVPDQSRRPSFSGTTDHLRPSRPPSLRSTSGKPSRYIFVTGETHTTKCGH